VPRSLGSAMRSAASPAGSTKSSGRLGTWDSLAMRPRGHSARFRPGRRDWDLKNDLGKITAGGLLGLIGAGVGVLGSILGPSAGDRARDEAIRANSERLRELTNQLRSTA